MLTIHIWPWDKMAKVWKFDVYVLFPGASKPRLLHIITENKIAKHLNKFFKLENE